MSDEQNNNPPEEVALIITWRPKEGVIKVDAPNIPEPVAFWLLDKAKRIVEMANMKAAQPRVSPAPRGFDPHKLGP